MAERDYPQGARIGVSVHLITPVAERRTVNTVQACALAGVSRRALYYWMESGKVEYACLPSGRRRIFVDSLLKRPRED